MCRTTEDSQLVQSLYRRSTSTARCIRPLKLASPDQRASNGMVYDLCLGLGLGFEYGYGIDGSTVAARQPCRTVKMGEE